MTEVVLIEAADAFTIVAVRGRLDAAGVGEADLKLTAQTVSRQKPAIIDLSDVGFIASLGIGMLVAVAKALRARRLGVAVVTGSSPVRHTLEITRLDPLIQVVATRHDALRSLGLT